MIICDTLRKYGAPSLSFGSENFQTGVNEVALLCMRSEIHQELYFTVCPAVGTFGGYLASCAVKRTPAGKGSERKYLMKSDCWDHCTGRAGETEPEGKPIKNRRKVLKEVRP